MMKHTWTLLAVIGLAVSSALADTTYMSGVVTMTRLELALGDQIIATGDLPIICDEDAIIDGLILGDPGVGIEIQAVGTIEIRGSIKAGNGANGVDVEEAGENGGDVVLNATTIELRSSTIIAGAGGSAGPSGDGGDGGTVEFVYDVIYVDTNSKVQAGQGGMASMVSPWRPETADSAAQVAT